MAAAAAVAAGRMVGPGRDQLASSRLQAVGGWCRTAWQAPEGWMCDCENMTAAVRDEKIALVFESVFEEHANDEGEVRFCMYLVFTVNSVRMRNVKLF